MYIYFHRAQTLHINFSKYYIYYISIILVNINININAIDPQHIYNLQDIIKYISFT